MSESAVFEVSALDDLLEGLPPTLSVSEAAKVFNVSEDVIRGAIGSSNPEERLPALRLGRGYTILTPDFAAWARARYSGRSDKT
jgi:hypothetical protein